MKVQEELRQIPMLRILTPLILGIVFHDYFLHYKIPLYWVISSFLFLSLTHYLEKRWIKVSGIYGFALFSFFFIAGFSLWSKVNNPSPSNFKSGKTSCIVRIDDQPQQRDKGFRCPITIIQTTTSDSLVEIRQQFMAWFSDSTNKTPASGTYLLCKLDLKPVDTPANPGQFDYAKYLQRQGIYRQAFISKYQQINYKSSWSEGFMPLMAKWRHNVSLQFEKNGLNGDRLGVAAALVLGDRNFLFADIQATYSKSGVMHILAVSGMHVAILYGFLLVLLGFLDRSRTGSVIQSIIILLLVWAYSFLTGLPPSVLRSAVMFTFLLVGKLLNRNSNTLNTLAASALCLILVSPNIVFDIGFQLSYMAVAGIIIFYEPIRKLFLPGNRVLNYIWELIAVSIAAQLTTTPLAIFYFHQFPNYFLLSNLIAVPASSITLALAIALLATSFLPWLATYLAIVLGYTIDFLNGGIKIIERLPGSVTDNLSISLSETFLIYVILLSGSLFLFSNRKSWLFICLSILLLTVSEFTYQNILQKQKCEVVYFSLKNNVATSISDGKQLIVVTNMDSATAYNRLIPYTKGYWAQLGCYPKIVPLGQAFYSKNIVVKPISKNRSIIYLNGRHFVVSSDPDFEINHTYACLKQIYLPQFIRKSAYIKTYTGIPIVIKW
jgi:competence protein ComEC